MGQELQAGISNHLCSSVPSLLPKTIRISPVFGPFRFDYRGLGGMPIVKPLKPEELQS
jgi:hypothetical protein